jgi:hypothetical protein
MWRLPFLNAMPWTIDFRRFFCWHTKVFVFRWMESFILWMKGTQRNGANQREHLLSFAKKKRWVGNVSCSFREPDIPIFFAVSYWVNDRCLSTCLCVSDVVISEFCTYSNHKSTVFSFGIWGKAQTRLSLLENPQFARAEVVDAGRIQTQSRSTVTLRCWPERMCAVCGLGQAVLVSSLEWLVKLLQKIQISDHGWKSVIWSHFEFERFVNFNW